MPWTVSDAGAAGPGAGLRTHAGFPGRPAAQPAGRAIADCHRVAGVVRQRGIKWQIEVKITSVKVRFSFIGIDFATGAVFNCGQTGDS